jgi:hypothetical protein
MAGWPQRSHRALRGQVGVWLVRSSLPQNLHFREYWRTLRLRAIYRVSFPFFSSPRHHKHRLEANQLGN